MPVRKRINPSVMVRTKTSVETAQKMKVWPRLSGYSFEFEGYLPEDQRRQNGEQHDSRPVKETLTHGGKIPCF